MRIRESSRQVEWPEQDCEVVKHSVFSGKALSQEESEKVLCGRETVEGSSGSTGQGGSA